MPAWVHLTLDTTPPEVAFGDPGTVNAGEDLAVPYVMSDALGPAFMDRAEIELRDGRRIPMLDDGAYLRVTLPEDTPDGFATVHAYVRDDVDNTADRTYQVAVYGVPLVQPPTPAPVGGLPPGARRHGEPTRIIRDAPSSASLSSAYSETAVLSDTSYGRLSSRYTTPRPKAVRFVDTISGTSTTTVTARVADAQAAKLSESTTVLKRPEGPGAEDELLLLDLL